MAVIQGKHFKTLIGNVVGITADAAVNAFVEPAGKSNGDTGIYKFTHKKQTYYMGWKKVGANFVLETITANAADASIKTGPWAKYFS